MPDQSYWFNKPWMRILQHFLFIAVSFYILLTVFKTSREPVTVDYVYTGLFFATILPVVYFNLLWLLPRLRRKRQWQWYFLALIGITVFFIRINQELFQNWSTALLPDFFFISYYSGWEIALFFISFLVISTLLKLSKSWFIVNELQRDLLASEKQKIQVELKALKAQINPHFFFNTLNSIYSMALDKDDRLPDTVLQLSALMRYFLYEAKEDFVPLQKETAVLQDYIALQKIRSGETLKIETKIGGEMEKQVIAPLLLVTFLENAFKHGAKGSTDNAFIRVELFATRNTINFRVENNKGTVDKIEKDEYGGLGLDNVKRRLELIYPGRHQLGIESAGDRFIVQLQLQL